MPARCPLCSTVLLDHEARGATCPACNGNLGNAALPSSPPRTGGSAPWVGLVAFGGILLLGVAALVGYLAWPRPQPRDTGDYQPIADGTRTGTERPSLLPSPKTEPVSDSLLGAPGVEAVEPEEEGREVLPPPHIETIAAPADAN